jgi:ABC-type antimicrobial peptide transport system permease subunit
MRRLLFVLAALALLVTVVGHVADERGDLFDLEAQGAGPGALRRHVRLRAAAVVALGIVGGAALGAALTALVVAAVLVTATGGLPEPPLVLDVDWSLIGIGMLAYVLLAMAVVAVPTWRAFRGEAAA